MTNTRFRQIAQLRAELAALRAELESQKKYLDGVRCPHCDELRLELGELRAENDRQAAELRGFVDYKQHMEANWILKNDQMDSLEQELREATALKTVEHNRLILAVKEAIDHLGKYEVHKAVVKLGAALGSRGCG